MREFTFALSGLCLSALPKLPKIPNGFYSPQLNLIEILWRFMKYEWIELNAYESWDSLVSYVEKVLRDFDSNYVINFA